jgi:RNA-directed DNA polymerase
MNDGRQKFQRSRGSIPDRDFYSGQKGEALKPEIRATESLIAECNPGSPTGTKTLMEEVCNRANLERALKRVKANKGSGGVDGMKVEELSAYLKGNWQEIKERLLTGAYKPQPVKRVEIPKPDGGMRKLGIPTVLDRFIQQAILQVLQEMYDKTFSEHSYGFRPKRSAQQAVLQAQKYISEGHTIVVDIDLEKFFDKVNHDRLMSTLAKRIEDKRMLKVIRAYLNAGVMEGGLVKLAQEGTPQGGNLSPLLSNIVLDELDKELEKRGHLFVRYADDSNIYVKSARAGERVMKSVTKFITEKLKLKVNEAKSAVDKPSKRRFLGYSFTNEASPRIRIAPKSLKRFKERIREITNRNRGISLMRMVKELMEYVRGWMGYYRYCQTPSILEQLSSWIRRRIRCYIWKQWKTFANRAAMLIKRGVSEKIAYASARAPGLWVASHSESLQVALPNSYFARIGVCPLKSFVKV